MSPPGTPPPGAAPARAEGGADIAPGDLEALLTALAEHNLAALGRFAALRPSLTVRHGREAIGRLAAAVEQLRLEEVRGWLGAWYAPRKRGAGSAA